jgi:hypothetical protein
MAIDVAQLIEDIKDAASQVLNKDVATLRGFSERQVKAIAQQAAFVEAGVLSGEITEETRDFFLDSLEDMALNFVKTLRGLLMVTIEKIWNAIVGVIWKAIETSTGIVLPRPDIN